MVLIMPQGETELRFTPTMAPLSIRIMARLFTPMPTGITPTGTRTGTATGTGGAAIGMWSAAGTFLWLSISKDRLGRSDWFCFIGGEFLPYEGCRYFLTLRCRL